MPGNIIGRPDIRILEALSLFEQLTAEQLARHLDYSFRYTQGRCKALTDAKYLQRLTLPKRTQSGGVPYVYVLGRRGRQYLLSLAEGTPTVKGRYRPSEEQARYHSLATQEILLQVRKITESDPTLSLERYITDREFHNEPIKVALDGQTVSLIPDLWLHMKQRIGVKSYTYCFCVEVNLTPLEQKRWRRKVSLYLNCEEAYTKRVGSDVLQVVTIINSPATILRRGAGSFSDTELSERKRALQAAAKTQRDYLSWTEKELVSQNSREENDLFLFTSAPLDSLTPHELLYSENCFVPFEPEPVSLLD